MLSIAFLISLAIHISVILCASALVREHHSRQEKLLLVELIDNPDQRAPRPPTPPRVAGLPQLKKMPPPALLQLNEPKKPAALPTPSAAKPEPSRASLPSIQEKEEPAHVETATSLALTTQFEGSGSESAGKNLSVKGDNGIITGQGTPNGGTPGGGYDAAAPGAPAQSAHRTNREAKPIQTVRANYPSMALRAGLESDVTLRVIVDTDGKVTHAAITKSGGAGFDEEALRAVKQSRFEPAQKDGQNVLAEFSYVFRFRMQR